MHYRAGEDFDRRIAMVGFDNAIEVATDSVSFPVYRKLPIYLTMDELSDRLRSCYAMAAPTLKETPTGHDFTKVVEVKVDGNLVSSLWAALAGEKVDDDTLVVCQGSISRGTNQQQARQLKGFIDGFRFCGKGHGPAFLLLGKALSKAIASEPDLGGRVQQWKPRK